MAQIITAAFLALGFSALLGYQANLTVVIILFLVGLIGPWAWFRWATGGNSAHPGNMGGFLVAIAACLSLSAGPWIGYVLQ